MGSSTLAQASRLIGLATLSVFAVSGLAINAWGQATSSQPNQTLDQVDAFNTHVVLDMAFDDPDAVQNPAPDYTNLGIAGSELAACKLATHGLYCLELDVQGHQVLRQWQEAQKPLQFVDLLQCDDSSLGLSGAHPCTGLTVDLSGAVWVAGRKSDTDYSLVKVVAKTSLASCPGSGNWTVLTSNPALCALEFATGGGVLSDLNAIDGDVAAAFEGFGTGILAIENGSSVPYFNLNVPGAPPTTFGDWDLSSGARLLSAALLQVPAANAADPVSNFLLATTSQGKVLSKPVGNPSTVSQVFDITAWEQGQNSGAAAITIDSTTWGSCLSGSPSQATCDVSGATLTANGGPFILKSRNGTDGLGVAGGPSGNEIDIGQSVVVTFPEPHAVATIQILFLFNGPEFNDKAEVAQITTDQGTYTLTVRNTRDDDTADWSGPGVVSKCGATTSSGTGCFLITNPFPSPVTALTLTPVAGNPPYAGSGSDNSDFAIGRIETAGHYAVRTSAQTGQAYVLDRDFAAILALKPNSPAFTALEHVRTGNSQAELTLSTLPNYPNGLTVAPGIGLDLANCSADCPLLKDQNGAVAASLSAVTVAPGPSGVTLYQIRNIPDCRYIPQFCRNLLIGSDAPSEDAARQDLINAGWIVPLDKANKLKPAAELLNVTPLLPEDVASLFDSSGVAPNGLPPLNISHLYRGQQTNQYRFDAFFFKSAEGVVFLDTFDGEFDVAKLTGTELGCIPVPGQLLKWDVITTVSETYKSVGGRYIDAITNVGCGTTKIVNKRLSLLPYNLEIVPDTFDPTIKSRTPVVTINNDAVFARLTQSLWNDVGALRNDYACKQADPVPNGGTPPLSSSDCKKLAGTWSVAEFTLNLCVATAFFPKNALGTWLCDYARKSVTDYAAALPDTATGPDVANRLGEQKAQVATFLHVFDTRFLPSIPDRGFCREKNLNSCPP